jgi:phosphoenolpyruvate synthase/pyruvate phosphate dikinase
MTRAISDTQNSHIRHAARPRQKPEALSQKRDHCRCGSNEYANLVANADFEPKEENPMLGFRGAARMPIRPMAYAAGFALECAALRRVRDAMGLTMQRNRASPRRWR